jgi:hypothetical protein
MNFSQVFLCRRLGLALQLRPIEDHALVRKKIDDGKAVWPAIVEYMDLYNNVFHIPNNRNNNCGRHVHIQGSNCLVDLEEAIKVSEEIFDGRIKANGVEQQVKIAMDAYANAQKVSD